MHTVVVILLTGVLGVATALFIVMGIRQWRRTRALARVAHADGMRFSPDDPIDVPRRYGRLALIGCGHSRRAENITEGRIGHMPVRMFDFRFEVGHGPRRITRHYGVIVGEIPRELPEALLWHEEDAPFCPLSAKAEARMLGEWIASGDAEQAERLAAACGGLTDRGISAQTRGNLVLLCVPASGRGRWVLTLGEAATVFGRFADVADG